MDSVDRENVVRQYVQRVFFNPTEAQLEESVEALTRAWQNDSQDVHERSYQDGGEGVLA